MAKALVLGNGSVLACFDERGQLSDFYFPHVGLENHVGGVLRHKIGIYVDSSLHWVDQDDWEVKVAYKKDALVSAITFVNRAIGITIEANDAVYNEHDILIRHFTVKNDGASVRELKLFLNLQFHISEVSRGDTAYYDPREHAIVHYKGKRVFLASARVGNSFFDDYSVGLLGIEGKEGTWRDAEDGVLEKCGVEHGTVDSVMGASVRLTPGEKKEVWHWIAASTTYRSAVSMHHDILARSPAHLLTTTEDYWNAWVNKRPFTFYGLDPAVADLFKKSLLVIRAHFDKKGGIIASSDTDILQYGRDTYSYVWPRDAAYTALALDKAGYDDISERFFRFCADAITNDGYLLHKYRPDGSLGSSWHPWVRDEEMQLPIQEDETAIMLITLWEHYHISRNLEFVEKVYNDLIKRAADFLVWHRHPECKLPLPSYDLWEERWGVSCYTSAAVIGGLEAAAQFAELLGKHDGAVVYRDAASAMKEALLTHFYLEEEGYFAKMITIGKEGELTKDRTVDASAAYGVFRFKVLPADDPRLVRAFAATEEHLDGVPSIGGIARYEGDRYYHRSDSVPGNPWFIPSFWQIEYSIARAKSESDLQRVKEQLVWAVGWAIGAGMLAEQIDPLNGAPLSVCPLTWSHATYVLAVIAYLEKLEELGICPSCYPVGN